LQLLLLWAVDDVVDDVLATASATVSATATATTDWLLPTCNLQLATGEWRMANGDCRTPAAYFSWLDNFNH